MNGAWGTSVWTGFRPASEPEGWFLGFTLAATLLAFLFLPLVFRKGPLAAFLVALCISWVPVQAIAFFVEGRRMWLPGQHSAIFFWGDSVMLTSIAVSFAVMRRRWQAGGARVHDGPMADRIAWRLLVALVSLLVSVWFHSHQVQTWPADRLHAPSKVWHDFFVYPTFIYYLGSQVPFVWQVPWRAAKVVQPVLVGVAGLGFLGWCWLGSVYDPSQVERQRPLMGFAAGPMRAEAVPVVPWQSEPAQGAMSDA